MNNKLLNMTLKLTLICAIAAFILGVVNIATEPVIVERKRAEQEEALQALSDGAHVGEVFFIGNDDKMHNRLMQSLASHGVIGEGDDIDEKQLIHSLYPVDKDGEVIKYILQLQGKGYGGRMILLAVFKTDGSFVKAKLMENNETPGLGKKAEESQYYNKFEGTGTDNIPVPISKRALSDEDAESISGRTIHLTGATEII